MKKEVKDCFISAINDEKKGKKHRGLLIAKPSIKQAEEYLVKAKVNLQLCDLYKEKTFLYKLKRVTGTEIDKETLDKIFREISAWTFKTLERF